MQVTVEDISSVKKTLRIEISQEEVAQEINKAYDEIKRSAKIKGFRPGKAPRSVLEKMFKKDVLADVSSRLIQTSFIDAIKEKDLRVVGRPDLVLRVGFHAAILVRSHGRGHPAHCGHRLQGAHAQAVDVPGERRGSERAAEDAAEEPREAPADPGEAPGARRGPRADHLRGVQGRQAPCGYPQERELHREGGLDCMLPPLTVRF